MKTCLSAAGVSTECSACWGNYLDDSKTCLVDICGIPNSVDGALVPIGDKYQSAECIECSKRPDEPVCGIDPHAMGIMGDYVPEQWVDQPLGGAKSSGMNKLTSGWILLAVFISII